MNRHDRQSFLGENSEDLLRDTTIGFVGLGGGGSHEVQQFAHIGIGSYVLVDPDRIDLSNTTRLIGGTLLDVKNEEWKTEIAAQLIRGLRPNAKIQQVRDIWQNGLSELMLCSVIVGAVDSYIEREQLERFARQHLIPYIDIGMVVTKLKETEYLISGQVILSMPGGPCLRCCGLIDDGRLEQEAKEYGDAGPQPQVVWPNGVLASTAVGLAVKLITPWHSNSPSFVYLEYDGNSGELKKSTRMEILKDHICPHHPAAETGDPMFDIRRHLLAVEPTLPEQGSWFKRLISGLLMAFEKK